MGYSKKLLFAVYGQFILVFSLISAVEFHKGFGLNAWGLSAFIYYIWNFVKADISDETGTILACRVRPEVLERLCT